MEEHFEQLTDKLDPTGWTAENLRRNLECHVYLARGLGYRAGVRPLTIMPPMQKGDEDLPPATREVFIEFPEHTVVWAFSDVTKDWIDTLPQYDR